MTVYMHDRNRTNFSQSGKILRIVPAAEFEIKCN